MMRTRSSSTAVEKSNSEESELLSVVSNQVAYIEENCSNSLKHKVLLSNPFNCPYSPGT